MHLAADLLAAQHLFLDLGWQLGKQDDALGDQQLDRILDRPDKIPVKFR